MSTDEYVKKYTDSLDSESRLKNIIYAFERGLQPANWAVGLLLNATDGTPGERRNKVKSFIEKYAQTGKDALFEELSQTSDADIAR